MMSLAGCATQTFFVNGRPAGGFPKAEKMQVFFLNGIAQEKHIDAAAVCGSSRNVAMVQVKQDPLDVVLGAVTWGIFTPRHAYVYCK